MLNGLLRHLTPQQFARNASSVGAKSPSHSVRNEAKWPYSRLHVQLASVRGRHSHVYGCPFWDKWLHSGYVTLCKGRTLLYLHDLWLHLIAS
jgi:hypothetical protein